MNASKAMAASGIVLSGEPATVKAPSSNVRSSALRLQLVGGDLLGLVDDAVARHGDGDTADGERPGAVRVHAERGDRRVRVQDVDVVGADPELLGDDHRPGRLVRPARAENCR